MKEPSVKQSIKCKGCSKLADLPPDRSASGSEWQIKIFTVQSYIGRSNGRSTPPGRSASGSEWQFKIFTVRAHIGRSTGRYAPQVDLPVDVNDSYRFVLLKLIWADQLADLLPNNSM